MDLIEESVTPSSAKLEYRLTFVTIVGEHTKKKKLSEHKKVGEVVCLHRRQVRLEWRLKKVQMRHVRRMQVCFDKQEVPIGWQGRPKVSAATLSSEGWQ